jgi:hypothetical protein
MFKRLFSTLVLLLLLVSITPHLAHADPAVSDSFKLIRTQLDYAYNPIAVKPGTIDTIYAYRPGQPRIYRSVDELATVTEVYVNNTAPYQSSPFDLFVTEKGYLLYPTSGTGQVVIFRGNGAGGLAPCDTLQLNCGSIAGQYRATMWNAAEDTVGIDKLYVGEYGGGFLDKCAYIWQGTWNGGGYTWLVVNDPNVAEDATGRHVHGMWVNQALTNHWSYAFMGDRGIDYQNPEGYMVRSRDAGVTWEPRPIPAGAEMQFLTLGFWGTHHVYGTDRGGASETNFLGYTTNDSTYIKADSLSGTNVLVPWCESKDMRVTGLGHGTIYVGTVNRNTSSTLGNKILITRDGGATWKSVYSLSVLSGQYKGVYRMSKFTNTGRAFYFKDTDTVPTTDATFKFELSTFVDKTDWMIGIGTDCDFATIGDAMLDTHIGVGDTLTLKTGQHHYATNITLLANMVVRGQSGVASDVVVMPSALNAPVFNLTVTGLTFKNFTCRTLMDSPLTSPFFIMSAENLTTRFRDVDFRHILSNHTGVGACVEANIEAEASTVFRFDKCDFDSCSNSYSGSATRGPLSFTNVQRAVIDSCTFSRGSAARGPLYFSYTDTGASNPFDALVTRCLFDSNVATGTGGGAVHMNLVVEDSETDTLLYSLDTFFKNNPATTASGQFYVTGSGTSQGDVRLERCIFFGNDVDYAMRNPPASIPIAVAKWTDCFANGKNHLWATVYDDTLQLDPDFVTTSYDSIRKFMPQSCEEDGQGSSCRVTADDSYMGWIEPNITIDTPVLTAPADDAVGVDIDACEINWTLVSSYPDSYAIRYGPEGGSITRKPAVPASNLTGLDYGTTYNWSVAAKDCSGWGAFSAQNSFTTENPPAPTLVYPEDEDTGICSTVDFLWNTVADADSYKLRYWVSDDTTLIAIDGADTTTQIAGLPNATLYSWQLAVKVNTWSEYSTPYTFETLDLVTFSLYHPEDEATDEPINETFAWTSLADADSFRLIYWVLGDTTKTMINGTPTEGIVSTIVLGFDYGQEYFWKVIPKSDTCDEFGTSSLIWSFTTTAPPAPVLVAPVDEAVDECTSVELIWNSVAGADSYKFKYWPTEDVPAVIPEIVTADTSATISSLVWNTNYSWSVAAYHNAWGDYSTPFTFDIVDIDYPTLLGPMVTLYWNEVADADSYKIRYGTSCGRGAKTTTSETSKAIIWDSKKICKWQVSAKVDGCWGPFSPCRTFSSQNVKGSLDVYEVDDRIKTWVRPYDP